MRSKIISVTRNLNGSWHVVSEVNGMRLARSYYFYTKKGAMTEQRRIHRLIASKPLKEYPLSYTHPWIFEYFKQPWQK